MPLTPNFTSSQQIGYPSIVDLEDTSTGSDAAITQRRVYLTKHNGTYLVPTGTTTDYIEWDYADSTISIDALDKDYALNIVVQWLSVTDVVLYTKTLLYVFTMYNSDYDYSLVSQEANGDASINNTNWFYSRIKLRLSIDDADNSISDASSITNGQAACDRGTYLRENQNLFY